MLNFCDFVQVFVFTTNDHLNGVLRKGTYQIGIEQRYFME